jgi:hypothetical protein
MVTCSVFQVPFPSIAPAPVESRGRPWQRRFARIRVSRRTSLGRRPDRLCGVPSCQVERGAVSHEWVALTQLRLDDRALEELPLAGEFVAGGGPSMCEGGGRRAETTAPSPAGACRARETRPRRRLG